MWRRGPDGVQDNDVDTLNATQVISDYLGIFQSELASRGLRYDVARMTTEMDIEGPHAGGYDVRLTQRDAILVRRGPGGPRVLRTRGGRFGWWFAMPTAIGDLAMIRRGWQAVDLRFGSLTLTFANLHTEEYANDVSTRQVKEFLRKATPSKKRQAIVVGNLNADPSKRITKAYRAMLAGGFRNTLPRRRTASYPEDLRTPNTAGMNRWVDHILVRPRLKLLRSSLTGTNMVDGLWASDHRGVVATLRLR